MVFKIIGGVVVTIVVVSVFRGCIQCPLKDIVKERPVTPE